MNKILKTIAIASTGLLMVAGVAVAANSTIVVTPTNSQGFTFNPDPTNATPYNFTEDQSSIGDGSLFVQPISSTAAHKFIAALGVNELVSDINSFSFDFMIAGNGDATDANQYYLNVYTNTPGSTTFYDCRYDYVATTGSTASFSTVSVTPGSTPNAVGDRTAGGDTFVCPATLAGMPTGSTVSNIAVNVGDTSTSDVGLAGYLDNVIVGVSGDTTTYDLELNEPGPVVNLPTSKDACKKGGWMTFTDSEGMSFKNQGQCVSYTNHN